MAITSQTRTFSGIGEIPVLQWKESSLLKPSTLKPILFTVERLLILRKLGQFGEADRQPLHQILLTILEVAPS